MRRSISGLRLVRTSGHLSWHRSFWWLSGQVKNGSISENLHRNQWQKWSLESCLPENVWAAPHVVLSWPFQNVAGRILQTGVCTTSLLRSSHDFSVPRAECLSPCCSFSRLRLWLKLCSKCCCTDFWEGVSGLQQRSDSQLIFTHPYNLEFVLCCLFSEMNFPYSKCQDGISGQKECQLLCKLIFKLHGLWTQIMWRFNTENIAGTSALCRQTK